MVITHIKCFQDSTDKNQTVWYPIQCSLLVHIWNTSILCPRTIQPHICASTYQNTNASPFILGLTMDFQGAKSGWVTNLQCLTLEMPRKTTDPQEAMSWSLILYVLKRWQNERFTKRSENFTPHEHPGCTPDLLDCQNCTRSVSPLITGVWPHWS